LCFDMGKQECAGCYEAFSKKVVVEITCECKRSYCSGCAQDQIEHFAETVEDNYIDKCEQCYRKHEGNNWDGSEGESSSEEGGCEICQKPNDEDKMLLCDYCDLAFHMYCLSPPLSSIPQEEWYCTDCTEALAKKKAPKRKLQPKPQDEADKIIKTDHNNGNTVTVPPAVEGDTKEGN